MCLHAVLLLGELTWLKPSSNLKKKTPTACNQLNKLFPLMMTYKINDLVFFLKSPIMSFNITDFVTFSSSSTGSSSSMKLKHTYTNNKTSNHFFFNWFPQLWNRLLPLDCSLPLPVLSSLIKSSFWSHLLQHFDPYNPCTFHVVCLSSKCLNYMYKSIRLTLFRFASLEVTLLLFVTLMSLK